MVKRNVACSQNSGGHFVLSMRHMKFSQRSVVQSFCGMTSWRLVRSYWCFGEPSVSIIRVWINQNGCRFIILTESTPIPTIPFNMIISAQIFVLPSYDNQTKEVRVVHAEAWKIYERIKNSRKNLKGRNQGNRPIMQSPFYHGPWPWPF